MKRVSLLLLSATISLRVTAADYHVSVKGSDDGNGSAEKPFRTISAAAQLARPGDVVRVHEGIYRERVTPPRGGESDVKRITYEAAPGEKVVIKGSEVVRNWRHFLGGVWRVTLPNSFFGRYNPYKDLIAGDWFVDKGRPHHTGEVFLNGKSLWETHLLGRLLDPQPATDVQDREGSTWTWFCESDDRNTAIYANFHDKNPNEELVEINVRDSCFYPEQPGCNYITVRGFRMAQAATPWAAPTAEQIGLIGTHWSKGWIIENNVISDSKCSGITLGKDRKTGHNVWTQDPSKDGAIHYNEVIARALEAGWSKANIGSHVVRGNVIFDCEQTGICGSLGAVFSSIASNHIYNIWAKRQFTGAEMGGIKLHAAIDVLIEGNHIHHAGRGLWMDWMAQGTRISGNLCHDNTTDDLFVEVNHGPFLVDNNILLSPISLRDWSEGGAYVHNLVAGKMDSRPELKRFTPYHQAHSTALAGLTNIHGGDNRFFNNLFTGGGATGGDAHGFDARNPERYLGFGPWVYNTREMSSLAGGNVYCGMARPVAGETRSVLLPDSDPMPRLVEEAGRFFLEFKSSLEWKRAETTLVTTSLLGKARVSGCGYENPDGSPLTVGADYLGKKRNEVKPTPGPFEAWGEGNLRIRVW